MSNGHIVGFESRLHCVLLMNVGLQVGSGQYRVACIVEICHRILSAIAIVSNEY